MKKKKSQYLELRVSRRGRRFRVRRRRDSPLMPYRRNNFFSHTQKNTNNVHTDDYTTPKNDFSKTNFTRHKEQKKPCLKINVKLLLSRFPRIKSFPFLSLKSSKPLNNARCYVPPDSLAYPSSSCHIWHPPAKPPRARPAPTTTYRNHNESLEITFPLCFVYFHSKTIHY